MYVVCVMVGINIRLYFENHQLRRYEMNKRFYYQSEEEKLSLSVWWWLIFFSAILLWIVK